ncbi:MAG: transketolase [Nocardioidaceae bacterium]
MTTHTQTPTLYGYDDLARLMSLMTGDAKHDSSATSTLDVLWVLYDRVLSIDRDRVDDPGRDRFVLSKGHGPAAYYAVLAAKGFLPVDALSTFGHWDSSLGHHPDRVLLPGVELSSGSLGHGLPTSVGVALGLRAQGLGARTYCLVGDAELDEGSNAEAIAAASRFGLGGLTAVVVDNASASLGWPGGIGPRFTVEGWGSVDVDGRDHEQIEAGLLAGEPDRPHVVVAHVEDKA